MNHLKARLFALLIILVGAGLTYYNWQQLVSEKQYSMKIAAFAPLAVIGGIFILFFPAKAGKPETTRDKFIVFIIFIIGLAVGLYNWYLMDPNFFAG